MWGWEVLYSLLTVRVRRRVDGWRVVIIYYCYFAIRYLLSAHSHSATTTAHVSGS